MKVGQIFTIEPMVNQGKHQDFHWPDKYVLSSALRALNRTHLVDRSWTCTTLDGKLSAQFEETLLITENGVEVLTAAPGWELPEEFRQFVKGEVKNGNSKAPATNGAS